MHTRTVKSTATYPHGHDASVIRLRCLSEHRQAAMKLEVVGGFILFMVAALWIWPLVSWLSVGSKAEVFRVPPLGHLSFAVAFAIFDGFRAGSQVRGRS